MNKKIIAVDIDDVLSLGAEGFVSYSNKMWGTNLTVEDYDERWSRMWQVDHEEEKRRAIQIYNSGIVGNFEHRKEALGVLRHLKKNYKLVITTSRVSKVKEDTLQWLDKNFPGIFEEVHLAGLYDTLTKDSHKLTKGELVREIGANYIIDDHPKHVFAAAEAGIPAILFGNYSWNRDLKLPKNVTRCKSWAEVKRYFDGKG
jgi:uncharacterized HAD superfamily protein